MISRIREYIRDESGLGSVLTAAALVLLAAASALAIDLAQIQYTRTQLQTAADTAALAGASAMLSYGDDQAASAAVAVAYAQKNLGTEDAPLVAVTADDVTFLKDGVPSLTDFNQIEVVVTRSSARGNALGLFFARVFGMNYTDVSARARAEVVAIDSSKCVKPFTVPAKFTWDDTVSLDPADRNNGSLDITSAEELASVVVEGYGESDIGTLIYLKPGDPHDTIVPSFYNLINLPPVNKGTPITGASMVNENIVACTGSNSEAAVSPGDEIQVEPGNSKGPVTQGVKEVIGMDPYAYWDSTAKAIVGSLHTDPLYSPRVVIIPFYDPKQPPTGGRETLFVHQLAAVFLDAVDNQGTVTARFMHTVARHPDTTASGDGLLRIPRLAHIN